MRRRAYTTSGTVDAYSPTRLLAWCATTRPITQTARATSDRISSRRRSTRSTIGPAIGIIRKFGSVLATTTAAIANRLSVIAWTDV